MPLHMSHLPASSQVWMDGWRYHQMERNTNPISPFDAPRSDTVECGRRRLKMMIGPRHLFNFHLPGMRDCDGMGWDTVMGWGWPNYVLLLLSSAIWLVGHWHTVNTGYPWLMSSCVAGVQAERDFYGITFRSLSNRHSSTTSSRSKGLRGNLFWMTELVVSIENFQKLSID